MGVTGINLNNSFQRMNSQGLNGGLKNVSFGKSCCNDTFTSSNRSTKPNELSFSQQKYDILLQGAAFQSIVIEDQAKQIKELEKRLNIQA